LEAQVLIKKLILLVTISASAGFFFVYILGKSLNLEKSIETIFRISFAAFIIFSIPLIVLPLINGSIR